MEYPKRKCIDCGEEKYLALFSRLHNSYRKRCKDCEKKREKKPTERQILAKSVPSALGIWEKPKWSKL